MKICFLDFSSFWSWSVKIKIFGEKGKWSHQNKDFLNKSILNIILHKYPLSLFQRIFLQQKRAIPKCPFSQQYHFNPTTSSFVDSFIFLISPTIYLSLRLYLKSLNKILALIIIDNKHTSNLIQSTSFPPFNHKFQTH